MSVPVDRHDIEQAALEDAEELAQKRYGRSFDDLPAQEQMRLWVEADQRVRERLNEAAELACEAAWDREHLPRDVERVPENV